MCDAEARRAWGSYAQAFRAIHATNGIRTFFRGLPGPCHTDFVCMYELAQQVCQGGALRDCNTMNVVHVRGSLLPAIGDPDPRHDGCVRDTQRSTVIIYVVITE